MAEQITRTDALERQPGRSGSTYLRNNEKTIDMRNDNLTASLAKDFMESGDLEIRHISRGAAHVIFTPPSKPRKIYSTIPVRLLQK